MAETKITSSEMAPKKYVDANGWTVYDFGTIKLYKKSILVNNYSIAPNARYSFGVGELPVGSGADLTPASIFWRGGFAAHCTVGFDGNIAWIGSTYTPGPLTFHGHIIVTYIE